MPKKVEDRSFERAKLKLAKILDASDDPEMVCKLASVLTKMKAVELKMSESEMGSEFDIDDEVTDGAK